MGWDGLFGLGGPDKFNRTSQFGEIDPGGRMAGVAGQSSQFGQQGAAGYGQLGARGNQSLDYLQAQAQGKNSVSAEQLRQALQQNLAAQRSMAASAAPQNQAMAARTASTQMGGLGAGLAGQQAMAGLAERNQAQQLYAQQLQGLRGQDLQAALGGYGGAMQGYGTLEQAGATRYAADMGNPSTNEKLLGMFGGLASTAAMSDKRLKKNVAADDKGGDRLLRSLKAYRYRYTDERDGKGARYGIMAQDLERTPEGRQAVIETPRGKAVHGGVLATALAATLPGIDKRIRKLEKKK